MMSQNEENQIEAKHKHTQVTRKLEWSRKPSFFVEKKEQRRLCKNLILFFSFYIITLDHKLRFEMEFKFI
jgi:hypothetical protein